MRGYSASRFSFNTEGGRCEVCGGQGVIKLEMSFLPNSYVPCEDCGGKRYNAQTLEVLYHERSIGDVMDMTIAQAAEFFTASPKIARPLALLVETGLGYLKLGQPSPTLSGGEAQRLKLATKLTRGVSRATNERLRKMRKPKSMLYLLEEPTIGLHMADVELLLNVLHRLVDDGNTVIVIEHNLSVIAEADYVVDIGPEAGSLGGEIVVAGTPEKVAKNRLSRTAPFLREVLAQGREAPRKQKASKRCHPESAERGEGPRKCNRRFPFVPPRRLHGKGPSPSTRLGMTRRWESCRQSRSRGKSRRLMLAYYLHDLDPFIFRVWGDFGPRWYGMAYVLAFACGFWLLRVLAKRGYTQLRVEQVGDFITWAALFGVMLGGRIGYVLFYRPDMLLDPLSIVRVWEGGMSSHGGMIGLIVFTYWYAWRHKLSWTNLGDNLVVVAPIGLFFGRCANFINGELYGRLTNVPWAMLFPKELLEPANAAEAERALLAAQRIDPSLTNPEAIVNALHGSPQLRAVIRPILTPRHPSQIYEALLEGVVLFAILWLVRTRTRQPDGVLTGLFFVCYAIFRIVVEYFREPDASLIAGFTRGQFFSFFLIAIGLAFIIVGKIRNRHAAPAPVL